VNLANGFTLTILSIIGDIVLRYLRNFRCLILGHNCSYLSYIRYLNVEISPILNQSATPQHIVRLLNLKKLNFMFIHDF